MKIRNVGNVAIEYLVVFLLVTALLFGQSPSAISQVTDAVRRFYQQFTFLLALP